MPSSKLLKERIESIQDTMKITNAMYLISSSKLRKARRTTRMCRPTSTVCAIPSPAWCLICRKSRCTRSSTTATSKTPPRLSGADGR